MSIELESSIDRKFSTTVGGQVLVYDDPSLAPGRITPRNERPFAYLAGNGTAASEPAIPTEMLSHHEQLWDTYGNEDSAAFTDGTLQHDIVEVVSRLDENNQFSKSLPIFRPSSTPTNPPIPLKSTDE